MKPIHLFAVTLFGCIVLAGCGNGPNFAEDANAKVKSQPAEARYELIKSQTSLSPAQKAIAIDNLPVTDDQKAKWKNELGVTSPPSRP